MAIPDPPAVFKPEMLVDVTFLQGPESSNESPPSATRLFVRASLIRKENGQSYVWVADQSDHAARRTPIETGATLGNGLVEVVRGLNLSTRLIVSGAEGLQDGTRIRVTGEENTAGFERTPPGS